jgi:serine/threonine-protein kinase HipA
VLPTRLQEGRNRALALFETLARSYSIETGEAIALTLAARAGIRVPKHKLLTVNDKRVVLCRRLDRQDGNRIAFLSALGVGSTLC